MVFQRINVDLLRPGVDRVAYAVQDDQYTRGIELAIYENNVPCSMPDGTTAVFSYEKQDGTGGNYDTLPDGEPAYRISGNIVTVSLAPQVLSVPGIVKFVVGIITDKSKIHTFLMSIDVQPNPGLQVTSENYFKVSGALADSGWEANMYLGTDENGKVVVKNAPSGGATGGVTFTPSVDADGNLSWSNNGGLENPETVNIKGEPGEKGDIGDPGEPGYTPVKGVDYYTAADRDDIVKRVKDSLPTVDALNFSNFQNGSFTETVGSTTVSYAVTFDNSGRPVKIDDIAITWEA